MIASFFLREKGKYRRNNTALAFDTLLVALPLFALKNTYNKPGFFDVMPPQQNNVPILETVAETGIETAIAAVLLFIVADLITRKQESKKARKQESKKRPKHNPKVY
jgi:uncharacterized membrane-anchored protein YitT (DUF2179 family)